MFIKDRISLESVISRVIILRHENTLWKLPEKEHLRLEKILDKIEEGCKINVYDDVKQDADYLSSCKLYGMYV